MIRGRPVSLGKYDVVVIGAGPAGSATAIYCTLHGLSVALVEQASFPRERPGETLPPGVEPLLLQLGIALPESYIRHTGHWVQWGGPQHFLAYGGTVTEPWRGFQIPRAAFDCLLIRKVLELGVAVYQPCRVTEAIMFNGRMIGVKTPAGELLADLVVDASGARSWLSSQVPLGQSICSPRLIARYGYAEGEHAQCDEAPGIRADRFGWYWTAKVAPGRYHWTRLCFDSANAPFAEQPAEFEHLNPSGGIRGADVTWRIRDGTAGDGYFLVGDAAFVIDPGSSHGVLKAVMSGMMAAHAIIAGIEFPRHQSAIGLQYRQWLQDWFVRDVKAMYDLYRSHPWPPVWLPGA